MCSPGEASVVNERDETGLPILEYEKVHLRGRNGKRAKQAYFLVDLKWAGSIRRCFFRQSCCCWKLFSQHATCEQTCAIAVILLFSRSADIDAVIHEIDHHHHPHSEPFVYIIKKKQQRPAALSQIFWFRNVPCFLQKFLCFCLQTLPWMPRAQCESQQRLGHEKIELRVETVALVRQQILRNVLTHLIRSNICQLEALWKTNSAASEQRVSSSILTDW